MPWHAEYYPAAMKHLPSAVRAKAIEIANALLEQGYDEAKAWAAMHPGTEDRDFIVDPDANL